MSNDAEFKDALSEASDHGTAYNVALSKVNTMFEERYGCTYSDADVEHLIDSLDYDCTVLTVEECDEYMSKSGHPKREIEGSHSE